MTVKQVQGQKPLPPAPSLKAKPSKVHNTSVKGVLEADIGPHWCV